MDSLNWKSTEILKVSGSTLIKGKFTAGIPSPDGIIREGKPTDFTPEIIEMIYRNIDSHVPYYLGHKLDPTRKTIGYAYKFGLPMTKDDLQHQGFVFDDGAKVKITTEGHDSISPEIDFTIDQDGKVIDARLDGMAFVPNPAIDGTATQTAVAVFSKATDMTNMTADEYLKGKGLTVEEISHVRKLFDDTGTSTQTPNTGTSPAAEQTGTPKESITPTPTAAPLVPSTKPQSPSAGTDNVDQLRGELNSLKNQYEQQVAKTEQLLGMQYDGIVTELKELGVDNPGEIVKGLPTENKITVLTKMKGTLIKKAPMQGTPDAAAPPSSSKATEDAMFDQALSELGVSKEEYIKIVGGT